MAPEKRPLHPAADPSMTEPAPTLDLETQNGLDVTASSYAGPWDLDPNWFDDQAEIDDLANAERVATASDILGWTDLEPIDLDALIGPATSPDQYGYTGPRSEPAADTAIAEDDDEVEDQL